MLIRNWHGADVCESPIMRRFRSALILLVLAIAVLLFRDGWQSPSRVQSVLAALHEAGLEPSHVRAMTPVTAGRLRYREWAIFALPETENRGGMLVVCDTNEDCDEVFLSLYRGVRASEAKPYFVRSQNGTVLMQLSATLDRSIVERYEAAIKDLGS